MTVFWILCALLTLLAAAFVVVPLWRGARRLDAAPARNALNAEVYRDQLQELEREVADGVLSPDQQVIARNELDRRALAEAAQAESEAVEAVDAAAASATGAPSASGRRRGRWLAPGALALIPVAAITTYLAIGEPEALRAPEQQFTQLVEGLAQRLAQNPDDPEGWMMLGRAYQVTGRMREAVTAFEKASALRPDNADLMAAHADALAMVQGSLAGKPFELVVRALALDPDNQTALALAATAAMENRQFQESIVLWQRLGRLVEQNSRDRAAIDEAIAQVRAAATAAGVKLAEASPAADGATIARPPAAAGAASISGEVTIAPELARQVRPDESLFVFARALDGPPVPLAVLRAQVKDLPLRFSLDDSLAMAPGARLSMHKTVSVSARISRSGQAMQQPGDLTGSIESVAVGASGVQLRISEVVR